ncbi:AbrB/MazE/SpoVT family DNA-binding domain-containing protein [Candidatus Kaiserbacteria bacterium]|nr:AbrB/MazE/SpoVT family DNA-binding domain-containing protein [Candidatus Kaiserbacteria bacterium]
MSQKVITVGNSLAVTIPKESAKKLGLRSGSRVEVEIDERRNTVSFKHVGTLSADDQRIAKLTANFMQRYDKDLRELARR